MPELILRMLSSDGGETRCLRQRPGEKRERMDGAMQAPDTFSGVLTGT